MPKKDLPNKKPKMLLGKCLLWLDYNWVNLQTYFLVHKTFCEIIFIFVYILEQVAFILALFFLNNIYFTVIAIYTAILIGTIGLERALMNFRINTLKENVFEQTHIIMDMGGEIKNITKRNKELEVGILEYIKEER